MALPRRAENLKRIAAFALALSALAPIAEAGGTPGHFDYWVLSLSWSPQLCQRDPSNVECQSPNGFLVHGLWPEYARGGYPDYCGGKGRLSDALVQRLQPLMPDVRHAQNEWRKHGTCSGMAPEDYVLNLERARRKIAVPSRLMDTPDQLNESRRAIKSDFVDANPGFGPDSVALQCEGRWLREVRFCMDKDFEPQACDKNIKDTCGESVVVRPIRSKVRFRQ